MASVRDCYQKAGYSLTPDRNPARERGWTCYLAGKTGERLRLCETFYSEQGKRWGLVDDWFEETINDRLAGPFWAVVTSEPAR
jgi:hypothetical protein